MKKAFLFLVVIFVCNNAVRAEDAIVNELKVENQKLMNQIEMNNEFIKTRENSKINLTKIKSSSSKSSNLSVGVEYYTWGASLESQAKLNSQAYTFSYTYNQGNWGARVGFSRILTTDFPSSAISTLVAPVKAELMYSFNTAFDRIKISPSLGYVYYSVSSPDVGSSSDDDVNRREQDAIDEIHDLTGLMAGITITASLSPSWNASYRAEFGRVNAGGIHIGYIF